MQITVTTDKSGTHVFSLEVNEEMEMENFIALCQLEVPNFVDIPSSHFCLSHSGRMIVMTATSLKKTFKNIMCVDLKELGIKNNDLIMVTIGSQLAAPSFAGNGSNSEPVNARLIADLVSGIKVPTTGASVTANLQRSECDQLRANFNVLRADPRKLSVFRGFSAELADAVERNDFEAFCCQYVVERDREVSRRKAMLDPTNLEGQRLIAEQIERENIEFSHNFAMEHMPEAYIPVTMLYIKMKINGVECKAFIDSGAQVSILSEETAERCNLMRLVDKRFQSTVHGVGGMKKMLGKIHTCQIEIEKHFFPCNFDVLSEHSIDILLGLDILRRHQCMIDLKHNCLRFGDSAATPFLSDAEAPRRDLEALGISPETVVVDSAKLASLIALGFDEEAARAMLIECGNDLEMAASNLLSRNMANF